MINVANVEVLPVPMLPEALNDERQQRELVLLQRFERVGVEEEGLKSHEGYSVSIHPWPFVWVAGKHNLAEGIADMAQLSRVYGRFQNT